MRSIAILLFAFFAYSAFATGFSGGAGTIADPYQIGTEADVQELATRTNGGENFAGAYFQQIADITLTSPHTPIGKSTASFDGSYDGDGCEVLGVEVVATSLPLRTNAFGFFGYCKNGTIQNLSVSGSVDVSGNVNSSYNYVGGVVGVMHLGLLCALENNCSVYFHPTIIALPPADASYGVVREAVGGVCGRIVPNAGASFYNLINNGRIEATQNCSYAGMAGIACFAISAGNASTSLMVECYNNGELVGNCDTKQAQPWSCCAGICVLNFRTGTAVPTTTQGCVNRGSMTLTGNFQAAGISAMIASASSSPAGIKCNSCTNYGDIAMSGTTTGITEPANVSGVALAYRNITQASCIMTKLANYGNINIQLAVSTKGGFVGGCIADGGGTGDRRITDCSNFGNITASHMGGSAILVGGVIANTGMAGAKRCYNFGDISVSSNSGTMPVGGIATYNSASFFSNCANFGNITRSGSVANGLAGIFQPTGSVNCTLSNCYNFGSAPSGALVSSASSATISDCYSYGTSPLVGSCSGGTISDCIIIGNGNESFVGSGSPTITNCIAINSAEAIYKQADFDSRLPSWAFDRSLFTPNGLAVLPRNKVLFPTPSTDIINAHALPSLAGYKRVKWGNNPQ